MKTAILATLLLILAGRVAAAELMTGPDQLASQSGPFTWDDARARTVRVLVGASKGSDGGVRRAPLGSGFLIYPDGLFVTAYHVMKYCLEGARRESRLATSVECSNTRPGLSYKAQVGDQLYDVEVLSFGKEK